MIINYLSLAFLTGDYTYIAFTDLLTLFDTPLCCVAGLPIIANFEIYFLLRISLLITFINYNNINIFVNLYDYLFN